MMVREIAQFGAAGFFVVFGLLIATIMVTLNKFVGAREPKPEKATIYECGEEPVGSAWVRFNVRYYIVAIIFLVFEMEIVLLLPCAVVLRAFHPRAVALLEVAAFVAVLGLGLAYVWARGHLEWVRPPPGRRKD